MKDKAFLEEIRNKIKKEEKDKKELHGNSNYGSYYPFWNIQEGFPNKATVRILPHAQMEDDSIDPFVYKMEHILSIGGEDTKIPCIKMYNEECPICALSAKYYKSEGKQSEKGKYYWRDRKALASALVVKDPLPKNEETGENDEGKLKVIQLGNQVAGRYSTRWKNLFQEERMDSLPWDVKTGYNFDIVKTKKGQYPNYEVDSDFDRDPSAVPDSFLKTWEPVDLTQYLPANPGLEKVQRMLDAHLTGDEYTEEDSSDTVVADISSKSSKEDIKNAITAKNLAKEDIKQKTHNAMDESTENDDDDDDDFLAKLKRRASAK